MSTPFRRYSLALARLTLFSRPTCSNRAGAVSLHLSARRLNDTSTGAKTLCLQNTSRDGHPNQITREARATVSRLSSDEELNAAYKPPTTGILSILPRRIVPYAELIRLDKPAGTYYLFLPCLFSTLLAAPLADPIAAPSTVLATTALFFTGALIMRGAGCTINDLWDRNLDPQVARTRLRPIARRAITPLNALIYLGGQLSVGLAILLQFPASCFFYATPSLLFVVAYPLAKRVTAYPQFVLGLTFSWGAFLGFPALGIDLLAHTNMAIAAALLHMSCTAWTIVYDMIYAYQDIRDDRKAGIKSVALAQEQNPKTFMAMVGCTQVALLAGAGLAVGASPVYFIGACGGAVATVGHMIQKVNLNDVKDCARWFRKGAWFTGGAIGLGMAEEYLFQYLKEDDAQPNGDP